MEYKMNQTILLEVCSKLAESNERGAISYLQEQISEYQAVIIDSDFFYSCLAKVLVNNLLYKDVEGGQLSYEKLTYFKKIVNERPELIKWLPELLRLLCNYNINEVNQLIVDLLNDEKYKNVVTKYLMKNLYTHCHNHELILSILTFEEIEEKYKNKVVTQIEHLNYDIASNSRNHNYDHEKKKKLRNNLYILLAKFFQKYPGVLINEELLLKVIKFSNGEATNFVKSLSGTEKWSDQNIDYVYLINELIRVNSLNEVQLFIESVPKEQMINIQNIEKVTLYLLEKCENYGLWPYYQDFFNKLLDCELLYKLRPKTLFYMCSVIDKKELGLTFEEKTKYINNILWETITENNGKIEGQKDYYSSFIIEILKHPEEHTYNELLSYIINNYFEWLPLYIQSDEFSYQPIDLCSICVRGGAYDKAIEIFNNPDFSINSEYELDSLEKGRFYKVNYEESWCYKDTLTKIINQVSYNLKDENQHLSLRLLELILYNDKVKYINLDVLETIKRIYNEADKVNGDAKFNNFIKYLQAKNEEGVLSFLVYKDDDEMDIRTEEVRIATKKQALIALKEVLKDNLSVKKIVYNPRIISYNDDNNIPF